MDPTTNPNPTPNPNPEAPAGTPEPAAPVSPEAPAAAPEVVNPIGAPVNPVVNPTNPVFQPNGNGVAATDPIMMPEPAKAPDPVEEELKAPMKAAAPAPGSIGSAVSGPAEATTEPVADNPFAASTPNQTPSVSFNDPAAGPDAINPTAPVKKTNKTTLIILVVVAAMVVIALAAVLIMQLVGGNSNDNTASNTPANEQTVIDQDTANEEEEESTAATGDLVCINSIVYAEDGATYAAGIASGQTTYNYVFAGGELTSITAETVVTHTDGTSDTENTTLTVDEYRTLAGLDADSILTIDEIKNNFETNINNFVTDTSANSSEVTSVENSCEVL